MTTYTSTVQFAVSPPREFLEMRFAFPTFVFGLIEV